MTNPQTIFQWCSVKQELAFVFPIKSSLKKALEPSASVIMHSFCLCIQYNMINTNVEYFNETR